MFKFRAFVLLCVLALTQVEGYKIGVGRGDCTGPSVEIVLMGYAKLTQRGDGIHTRQYSRAFIVGDGTNRIVYVSADAGMIGHGLRREVVKRLQKRYGNLYSMDNVMISGTHTHSGPGGYLMELMYDMPTFGFVRETFVSLVDGLYKSIVAAHENMQEGRLYIGETEVLDASINRSPLSYLSNPREERDQYTHNTDKKLTQIKFVNSNDEVIGAINWFAVHPVSMNNTNHLVSADNVGYASYLLEKEYNPTSLAGQGSFVGVFAAANLGDVSPNTKGPKCEYSGNDCDPLTSSCPDGEGACFASGPGRDIFESTKIIGERIYAKASELIKQSGREITGDVNSVHQFVDMPNAKATYLNPKTKVVEEVRGCIPAMGYSFAAGTTDGPGAFDFTQGSTTDNPLWNLIRDFITEPQADDIACHAPKPILLPTGRISFPYEWQPQIIPTQVLKVGDVFIAGLPGEFTTMSGRRIRRSIKNAVLQATGRDSEVITAGMANIYSSYVVTPEEYQIQRYEGASTIFGPHTLTLYIDQFEKMVTAMLKNEELPVGPLPPTLDDSLISFTTPVVFDGHPIGRAFGSVRVQPSATYSIGDEVHAKFVAGNPRNNLMHGKTYFTVDLMNADGNWETGFWDTIATDANWETKFVWERVSSLLGHSDVDTYWKIPEGTKSGTYRVCHFGHQRELFGEARPYSGCTRNFTVAN